MTTGLNAGGAAGPDNGIALRRLLTLALALVGAMLLAWFAVTPPAPLPEDAAPKDFSADRAMADVRAIAAAPHPLGSAHNAQVIAYLGRRLDGLGMTVTTQRFAPSDKARARLAKWSGWNTDRIIGTNVIGIMPGRDRTAPALVLMAHHDTVWQSPGAADDTIGTASILEILRAIREVGQPQRDVIALFTDGEEVGLEGARAYWAANPLAARTGVIVNLESRGAGGRAMMFETGARNGGLMRLFARAVPTPSAASIAVAIYHRMPNSTDLTVPLKGGAQGFNFAPQGRAALYHSPLATPDRLDRGTLQDMGGQALALAQTIAFADALPPAAPDMTFADILGSGFVAYPAWGGWVVLALAAAFLAFAWMRIAPAIGAVVQGMLGGLWLVANGALLLRAINLLSGSGEGHNYYDRLAALPRLEVQAFVLCLLAGGAAVGLARPAWPTPRWVALILPIVLGGALLAFGGANAIVAGLVAVALAMGWFVDRTEAWPGWIGAILLVLIVSIGLQAFAPTTTPPFTWPLLLACLAAALTAWMDPAIERPAGLAVIGVIAVPAGGQVLALAHFVMLSVGAELAEVQILFALLMLMLLRPLIIIPRGAGLAMGAGLAVAGVGIALWVLLDPIAPTVAAYSIDRR